MIQVYFPPLLDEYFKKGRCYSLYASIHAHAWQLVGMFSTDMA